MERRKRRPFTESYRKRPGVQLHPRPSRREYSRRSGPDLELIVQAGGNPDHMTSAPGRGAGAAVVDELLSRAVMAVRRDSSAAGAEIIVGVGRIDRVRRIDVPVQGFVEMVFPRNGVHVRVVFVGGRIVIVLPARIARRPSGMCPAYAQIIVRREVLREREPQTVSLPLVLKLVRGRQIPLQVLVDSADRESEWEGELRAD